MKQKDINKQANDFSKSLIKLAHELQAKVMSIQDKDAKELGIDIEALNLEAKEKVKELQQSMRNFENKVKAL